MKKIILGIVFSFVFLTSSVFASGPYNVLSASEVKTYESLLSTTRTLSTEVNNMRIIGKLTASQEQSFQAVIINLMSNILAGLSNSNISNSSTDPFISSIDKSSGPIGTTITLKGSNLAGFEGDLDAWIENGAGEKGYLPGIYSGSIKTDQITIKIPERACKQNNSYSGNSCTSYLNITPGVYKLYTSPWGKKSNVVTFEVTSPDSSDKINAKAFFINGVKNNDNECGIELVEVNYGVRSNSPLRDIINTLLSIVSPYGDDSKVANPITKHALWIDDVSIKNRVAIIKLKAKEWETTSLGYCSKYTVYTQIKKTALQFSTVDKVEIYVNNENLADALNH